jgi:hypothetical protein
LDVCNATPKPILVGSLSHQIRSSDHVLSGKEFLDDYLQLEELRGSPEYRIVVRHYFHPNNLADCAEALSNLLARLTTPT